MTPAIAAVVCTIGRPEVADCLHALSEQDHPAYEVIVVDNRPDAGRDVERLAARLGARYVREPLLGLSRARNTGARATAAPLVAFCDDDAVPEPGWLSAHAAALADERLGATTGRTIPVGVDLAEQVGEDDLGPQPRRFTPRDPLWFEYAAFGGVGVGNNMAFRRELVAFHEGLGVGAAIAGSEEHHAFFCVLREGHEIAYVPEALVRHHERADHAAAAARRRRALVAGAAYMTMLLVDEPRYRRRLLRHLGRGLRGPQAWRPANTVPPGRVGRLTAAVAGVAVYARGRLKGSFGPPNTRLGPPTPQ